MTAKKIATLDDFINQLDAGKWENPQILHIDPQTGLTTESPEVITYNIGQPRIDAGDPDQAAPFIDVDALEADGRSPMDSYEQTMATEAIEEWDDLIAPEMRHTSSSDPDISFNYTDANVDAITIGNSLNRHVLSKEDVWIPLSTPGTNYIDDSQIRFGSHAFATYVHELGHALGLNHPGNYNETDSVEPSYDKSAIFAQDTIQYSAMSYFLASHDGGVDNYVNGDLVEPETPMLYDVAAVQAMYGADMQTRLGDTVYGFHSSFPTSGYDSVYNFDVNTSPDITIYDAGGNDTLDVSGFSQDQIINLAPGSFSSIGGLVNNVSMAFNATSGPNGNANFNPNAVIENAVGGSGSDTITGNDVDNVLTGGGGNDTIDGGKGTNTAVYSGNASQYVITFNADGTVTVADQRTGANDGTDTLKNIEELRFADRTLDVSVIKEYTDSTHPSVIIGGEGNDVLSAQDVTNNTFIVGGAGADLMYGGSGNDIFFVDNTGDRISEIGNNGVSAHGDMGGVDEVRTTLNSYTLPEANAPGVVTLASSGNIENLTFSGTGNFIGTGNSLGNVISGGVGDDTLTGGGGNDTIDGRWGVNTAVYSGNSSDYKIVRDVITDLRPGSPDGSDTLTNIQFLKFADGVKSFASLGGSGSEMLVGDSGNNTLVGGDGNDTLTGFGGNDTLDGGAGTDKAVFTGKQSDYLFTFNADGSVTVADQRTGWDDPTTPDGTDTLKNIEQIQFADKTVNVSDLKAYTDAGHSSVMVGGSDLDISGEHAGNVVLVGNGAGHLMYGSSGDNIYYIDNAQQVIYENVGGGDLGGVDEVRTTLSSYALPDPNQPGIFNPGRIENLTFVGTGSFHGTGNSLDNVITGGAGDDILTGGGGNDTIDGGAGNNTAVYSGNFSEYKISVTNGVTTITDLRAGSPDGTDTLKNIELLQFADGTKHFSPLDYVSGSVAITDSTITEGNNGPQAETFTLTRTGGNAAFDVNFATADGSATTADGDYLGSAGTVHFNANDVSKTITVTVNGDTKVEPTETYDVNLSGATNGATISHAQGVGIIVNDDVAPPPPPVQQSIPESAANTAGSEAHPNPVTTDTHHAASDFNGDGFSDLLLGNSNGQVALWELNGSHIASNTTVGSVPAGWHIDATGDFNGDGKSDILLHNDNGQVALWQMNGDHVASNTTVGSVSSDWHIATTGDFNGDGKTDILWENSKGQVAMWEMNGDKIASNTTVGSLGTDWHVAGTGDFNGDGKADILWENSKGQVAMWQMNGDHIASNTTVGSVSSGWQAAGIGDFNGDGKADVLWQNSNGQVAQWQMNGDHIAANTTVGSAAGSTVIGTGDYNHDGKADVLLQNASGNVTEWQMNGDHIAQNQSVGSHTVDWHMV